jgi:2-polyprenyl-6-methoxyphenol hydroxylase-like FAD-dependent oxidoreductase
VAGATAATVLGAKGIRVTLLDARDPVARCFKAEKIEADQAALLRKFGLLKSMLPVAGRIREILNAQRGKVLYSQPIEQYGIHYHDMVNIVRQGLPAKVDFRIGRVEGIETGPETQRVRTSTGEELTARLLVVASGTAAQLCAPLGIHRRMIREKHSLAIGFDIAPNEGAAFPFDSVTYYPAGVANRIAYLTLFLIGRAMRANLFLYRTSDDSWVRQFTRSPAELLEASLPGLTKITGPFRAEGRVECAAIHLYKAEQFLHPGLILIGDAFQSVCPSTGTGLSRVLTDVDVLTEHVPHWLETPGMGLEKMRQFYDHPSKIATDASSLGQAEYVRDASTSFSRRWVSQQVRLHANAWIRKVMPLKKPVDRMEEILD